MQVRKVRLGIRIVSIKHRDFADFRDQRSVARRADLRRAGAAQRAVVRSDAHLDEFVIDERTFDFCHHTLRQAAFRDGDDGFQVVCQAAQVFTLVGVEVHVTSVTARLTIPDHRQAGCAGSRAVQAGEGAGC